MRSCGWIMCCAAVWVLTSGIAQAKPTAAQVLTLAEKNYSGIRDSKVDVDVSIHSPQVQMPDSKGTIYFKRPDKVTIVAREGFIVLPKDTFPGDPIDTIRKGFDSTYEGESQIGGLPVHVLKLVPKTGQFAGIVKLYVEKARNLIVASRAESNGGKFASKWSYARVDGKYWLPSVIRVNMEGTVSQPVLDPYTMKMKPPKSGKGSAIVKFSNYRINKRVPDSVFAEKR